MVTVAILSSLFSSPLATTSSSPHSRAPPPSPSHLSLLDPLTLFTYTPYVRTCLLSLSDVRHVCSGMDVMLTATTLMLTVVLSTPNVIAHTHPHT
jgi:hypothetical protein